MTRLVSMLRLVLGLGLALVACGGDSGQPQPKVCGHNSGMNVLADFDVPCDPGGNGILLTASGEAFAKDGYAFPPISPDQVVFVDGWAVSYDRVLTTFDHITLSDGPDKVPTDQSRCDDGKGGTILCGTGSSVVAQVDGPFAIDLHKGGPLADADGADMDVAPVAALTGRSKQGNAAFDPTMKYAFGFAVVAATLQARNVNLDAAGITDYQEMVAKGYTTLLVGTATWQGNNKGNLTGSGCTQTAVTPAYDFSALPRTVKFRLGFTAPTIYRNAQNPQLTGAPLGGEEHPRGVTTVANQSTIAQLTFHLDHAFWESFVHDSPAHFDTYAARYAGMTAPTARLEDFKGYALKPFIDPQGRTLPWRSCLPATDYTAPGDAAMTFDTRTVQVSANGDPSKVIRDFYDYNTYNHSTFGHLNADGLSFVDRQYPSPP
ncbi:MAG: hypothetical protein E6J90_52400 [Deltaproteobacteria bacterium]|nr:MAG: hypothetical protein E6J90_52400 [Deltaproteobacteria bacterium]